MSREICRICGSFAINHKLHGRDGSDPDLCDVCYWRTRAMKGVDIESLKRYTMVIRRDFDGFATPVGKIRAKGEWVKFDDLIGK